MGGGTGGLCPNHRCWSEKLVVTVMGSIFTSSGKCLTIFTEKQDAKLNIPGPHMERGLTEGPPNVNSSLC